jgi:glycosyltransferase involved in cell wall biosynthesis
VPCLFFAWQNIDKPLPAPFPALRRYVFRNVRGGIAGTEEAAAVLRSAGYDGPIAVIPQFGVDPERFAPDPNAAAALRAHVGVRPGDLIVGYAGRLVEEKGLALLLEAVARLEQIRLVIVGGGPMRAALERRARAEDLEGRVHFQGDVTSCEMPQHLAGIDILALPSLTTPSWKEQFGRVLVEAMACGIPVVGSDSGEIPQVIGDAGLIVAEGDADALTQALRQLAEAPALRAELGRRARKRVLARYTNDRIAEDTVTFYRELLGAGVAT